MRVPITPAQLHDPIANFVQPAGLILHPDDTVATALDKARQLPSTNIILYCYVVDGEERLVGVVPIRRLLTTPPEARVDSMMIHDVVAVPSWATVLVAAEVLRESPLPGLPRRRTRRAPGGHRRRQSLHRRRPRARAAVLRGNLPDHRRPRHRGPHGVDELSRSVSVAALQRRGRTPLRGAGQPLRTPARRPRGARAFHSRRSRTRRERQHPVGDAHAAEPVGRSHQLEGLRPRTRQGVCDGGDARARMRIARRSGRVRCGRAPPVSAWSSRWPSPSP